MFTVIPQNRVKRYPRLRAPCPVPSAPKTLSRRVNIRIVWSKGSGKCEAQRRQQENDSSGNETVCVYEVIDGPCVHAWEKEVGYARLARLRGASYSNRWRHAHVSPPPCLRYTVKKHGCASTSALSCEAASRARRADARRVVLVEQIGQLGATRPRRVEWRPVGCMLLLLAYCSSIPGHRYQPNRALSLSAKRTPPTDHDPN